jgi:hypothetical protein
VVERLEDILGDILISPPQAGGRRRQHAKLESKFMEGVLGNGLSEDISNLGLRRDITGGDGTCNNFFSNKVEIQFNVFGASVEHRIHSHVESTSIIAKQRRSSGWRNTKVTHEIGELGEFSCGRCHSSIFNLSTGPGDGGLLL